MAITTENSTELANANASPPVKNAPTETHGRVRIMFFSHTQGADAGDATSYVNLGRLPAGRVRVLLRPSRAYVNWIQGSATLDLGWGEYTSSVDGSTVAADADGLVDGKDVDTVGYFEMEGTLAAIKATGGTKVFESKDGVLIRAASTSVVLAAASTITGYLLYVID